MDVQIESAIGPTAATGSVEVVERKGRGHPDTLCDAIAEAVGTALSSAYLERFGTVLHHNVDKVLLVGGSSRPAFGGGEMVEPIEIVLAGRATRSVQGARVDVDGIALEAARSCLRERVSRLDVDRHVRFVSRIRPGADELVATFTRQAETGVWLANDTSVGVGYAPLSRLERTVLELEQGFTSPTAIGVRPERGEDMKVMGVRCGGEIELTIANALVGGALSGRDAYREVVEQLRAEAEELGRATAAAPVRARVNTADDPDGGELYLTVTGTSAEAGDDGEAGRGNRVNGLITPMRPMTMESVAGKNPVSHVGKIYNVLAGQISEGVCGELEDVVAAEVYLVSRIGCPVREPQLVRVRVWMVDSDGAQAVDDAMKRRISQIVRAHLDGAAALGERLARGEIATF